MKSIYQYINLVFVQLIAMLAANGQPVESGFELINGYRIYKDARMPDLFYYEPSDFKLSVDHNGKPEFHLLKMRYTGTRYSNDEENKRYNNSLRFKIVTDQLAMQGIKKIKDVLQKRMNKARLRSLPITRFESVLVFASAGNEQPEDRILTTGFTETGEDVSSEDSSYWVQRIFSIRLSNTDAQLVEAALEKKQTVINLSYAFYTRFAEKKTQVTARVNGRISKMALNYFDSCLAKTNDSSQSNVLLKADVVDIFIDINKWRDAIELIDINERVPDKYPLFDVYCYDFNNSIRPDLFSKKIEIKATSVNGKQIIISSVFRQTNPDQYAKSIRSPYALRLDKPYQYRVIEINNEGETGVSAWLMQAAWSPVIDITSQSQTKTITNDN